MSKFIASFVFAVAVILSGQAQAQALQILTPVAGDTGYVDQMVHITWSPNPENEFVKAYLETKNPDGTFKNLGECTMSAKGSIYWDGQLGSYYGNHAVPGDYYIRLVDTNTGEMSRMGGTFTLKPRPTVDVKVNGSRDEFTVPSGGGNFEVSWTSTDCASVTITVSSGRFYYYTSESLPPSGSKMVYIPESDAAWGGFVGAQGVSAPASLNVGYAWDSITILPPELELTSPVGGEVLTEGTVQTLKWHFVRNDFDWYQLVLKNKAVQGEYQIPNYTISKHEQQMNVFMSPGLIAAFLENRGSLSEALVRKSFYFELRAIEEVITYKQGGQNGVNVTSFSQSGMLSLVKAPAMAANEVVAQSVEPERAGLLVQEVPGYKLVPNVFLLENKTFENEGYVLSPGKSRARKTKEGLLSETQFFVRKIYPLSIKIK